MKKTRYLFTEALNPLVRITNSIVKKLNYVESSLILRAKSYEDIKDFLTDTATYYSNSFDELAPEQQDTVTKNIWLKIHKALGNRNSSENIAESDDKLEAKIYTFLKNNGGILFPLEVSAKKLADAIRKDD